MFRSILAVVAGYAVLAVGIVLLFSVGFGGARPEGLPTRNFLLLAIGAGFVAAVAGGWVTVWIARGHRWKHIQALAALILLLAAVHLFWTAGEEPLWFQLGNIAAGVTGVFVGGSLKRGSRL
jgi:DMSO/TMAO reductase YedYZ heme-binding membrane subunit